jgi:hypothetical protein
MQGNNAVYAERNKAMRDTIDMAETISHGWWLDDEKLKAFEALVRADQDEKYKWDIHSCGPTCKRYACVAMREAVEAEREACAKLTEERGWHGTAAAIRNRGNT